ncbi:YihY/virulence factor BrkB family protein [Pseudomonas aeruginosa]|uniref:YihY/virulence factor BrkB family protein n=1 Tax=Pseudomonas aeruginosa TaxID=287 RepID=UPI000F53B88E|nr:YihY/virulence factor BrkB family protein [Pseudomonas aeruginosa]RQA51018.1 ribonuclease BN [Pseudomonas aeruginosa]
MFRTAYREIGLFGLVKRTVNEFLEDDMPTYASALAYQMLFSLFPFLLVLITLVGYLHLPEFFAWLREQAALLLPPEAMDQVNPVIDQLQQQKGGLLSIGIAVALWTSSAGIRSMMIALNAAYDVKESRPVWKRFSLSILYTLGIALLLLVAAGLMVTGPQVIAWIAASLAYGFYVKNFANYNAMYGSIGAIIILLLYFYLSAAVVLFGAELNAVIEHHSEDGKDPGERELPDNDDPELKA